MVFSIHYCMVLGRSKGTAMAKLGKQPASPTGTERLGRADWVAAARSALVEQGVAAVKVDVLARAMGVSRGSFYWHFKSREDLLAALLEDWRLSAISPFVAAIASRPGQPQIQLLRFSEVWLDEQRYDPRYDAALRDWARSSPEVDARVREVDDERVALLRGLFAAIGYGALEAEVRARILYYHQVGYYALHIVESASFRRKLLPVYFRVLAGFPVPAGLEQSGEKSEVGTEGRD